ncbi:phage tail tape measure protein [Streptomyces ardesiacus]|uniref:phage tail tape measure protein n=1 Tax=Streptomyces ardesiacus TaxID=285564 RepID=UPI00368922D4
MANWNLSVDIRGHGNDLAQSLKSSAKHARSLGTAARTAKSEVRELGHASQTASRHIRTLGREARTAGRHLGTLGSHAQTAGRRLDRYGNAAQRAHRHVTTLGNDSRTAGRQLARMSGQIDTAVRDLLRLADAARRADAHLGRVGRSGATNMRRYHQETSRARDSVKSLAVLLSGGALTLGAADLVKEGGEYQQAMNAFGATTGATQLQMQRAAATANQLGNDLRLPGATAADAAEAMVELAKAGFRTDQAISSTQASLVLASAAQVNAADSAKYLGDMMDQFGMGADKAGVAADTLAATANAASGDIIDIYYAMKYAGPVAHGMGVSMQEAASAVGMLGKAGILGQTAGTTLRGMLANLASPTKQMTQGLQAMGIQAWDAQGNFKGLRYVIDGLAKAEHRMTQKDFAAAVKKSMGKPAMSGAIALAHQGVDSFDALMAAVTDTGAASDIAAAKGKGLAGAMLQLKTQARQTGLTIYQGMAPGLEWLVRNATDGLSKATPKIEHFFDYFNDAATLFGPDLAAAARKQFDDIGDAASDLAGPFKALGEDALASFLHLLLTTGQLAIDVLSNLAEGATPVISAFGSLSGEGGAAASALDTVVYAVDLAARAVGGLSTVLGPIGHMVGNLVSAFGALPGPIQQFVLAALLVNRIQPRLAGLAGTVSGRVTGAFRGLNDQMLLQQRLAAASGTSLTRFGAAMAVLQTRVPVIGRMGDSFRTASSAASGFAGTLRGVTAAAGTGLRGAMSGLMGVMGGPWGLALTGMTVGLGMLAQHQQKAAQAAAEHQQQISSLSQALRESNGLVDENVRAIAAENLMQQKTKDWYGDQRRLVDLAREAKIPFSHLVDAYTEQGTSLSKLRSELDAVAKSHTKVMTDAETGIGIEAPDELGKAALALKEGLGNVSGDFKQAAADAKSFNEGVKGASEGVSAYSRLKDAVGALADKTADADSRTRALRDALDLLSGGSVSLQAAQARVNEAIANATDAMAEGIDKADGWGKALLNTNGTLNTTTKNGQQLFGTLNTIADGSASAAIAAYDFAQSQGKDLPESLAAARGEMEKSRKAAIDLGTGYGLTKKQAGQVADSMGLIPGQVSILLQTEGVDQTLAELLAVQAEFKQFPDKKTIKVDALGSEAKKELEDIGYKIELIPGTREYKITAPTKAARAELDKLLAKMSQVPGSKSVKIDAKTRQAITDLEAVQSKVKGTNGKTITMKAPTAAARKQLEALGFKIKAVPGSKNVTITIPTGGPTQAISSIQGAINSLRGKNIGIGIYKTEYLNTVRTGSAIDGKKYPGVTPQARGSVLDFYADGGMRENHVAQIAPAGQYRVWAEQETGGESYIPLSPTKRPRSRAIAEETVRRLGGDPARIQWHANGGVTSFDSGGFSYTPSGLPRDTSYVQSKYSDSHQPIDKDEYNKKIRARKNAVDSLRSAEAALAALRKKKHTHAQIVAAENRVSKARRNLATATDAARKAEARYKQKFSLSDWQKTLKSSVKANAAYEANLKKISARGGAAVIDQLRDMGEEGSALIAALAKASSKQFKDIVANLKKLGPLAKASLADYTAQLNASNKQSAEFQSNLAKLSSMGYGDLATMLAEQGDEVAQKIASEAVKSKSAAAKANAAAKQNNQQLSSDEMTKLIQIIAAISNKNTGIHQVADKTGFGEDEIIQVGNKAKAKLSQLLGGKAARFLADLAKANKGQAYENGGIRAGMYATQGGIVRFAEPSTRGEAYIPLGQNKRSSATRVLSDVATRFGLGLTDGQAGRVVIIREQGPLVGESHFHIGDRKSDRDLARAVESQQGYQLRRLARGGVAARGAS